MQSTLAEFSARFKFRFTHHLLIGLEREHHFTDLAGNIVPIAPQVLAWLKQYTNGRHVCHGYELSGCQGEERIERPCRLHELDNLMGRNEAELRAAEKALSFQRAYWGAAPHDMPLDVYPDERYERIVRHWPIERLRAACRVTGVHVLIGMSDPETAVRAYNRAIEQFQYLCELGDSTNGERLQLFRDHLVDCIDPPPYRNWQHFHERMVERGFATDPRRLWDFIRISTHGAIEFRMFDTTDDWPRIKEWVRICLNICRNACK
ncbi:MAG: hypothetical protein WC516_03520 [Patescibacteria group bacterium]